MFNTCITLHNNEGFFFITFILEKENGFIIITDSNNCFRISQIRILKNFIETKINFSPSPLWFSKSVLWVLASTFHDYSPKPSLLIQQHVYIQKKKKTYTTGHFGTINSYNGTPVLAYRYRQTVCSPSDQKNIIYWWAKFTMEFWPW